MELTNGYKIKKSLKNVNFDSFWAYSGAPMWPIKLTNFRGSGLEFKEKHQVKLSYNNWQHRTYQWLQNWKNTLICQFWLNLSISRGPQKANQAFQLYGKWPRIQGKALPFNNWRYGTYQWLQNWKKLPKMSILAYSVVIFGKLFASCGTVWRCKLV